MVLIKKIVRKLLFFFAPLVFVLGKILKSSALLKISHSMDDYNVRAVITDARLKGRNADTLHQLTHAINLIGASNEKADGIIKSCLSQSQSQLLQDIVCVLVNHSKNDGYFVEVGVGDGVNISNTYLLEKQFGWNGLLVEPSKAFHKNITAQRQAILDKRAAASSSGEILEFEEDTERGEFSKLVSSGKGEKTNKKALYYEVETATLTEILKQHNAPSHIDYMSIDTEGTEVDILAGLDLDHYTIGLFTIEHNYRPETLAALRELLEPKGYHQIYPTLSRYDIWYVHDSIDLTYVD
ncbi:MAG: FkbM family methyltransferase [Hyphomicrobiales bacterium]